MNVGSWCPRTHRYLRACACGCGELTSRTYRMGHRAGRAGRVDWDAIIEATCTMCGITKLVDEFHRYNASSQRRRRRCRECRKAMARGRTLTQREQQARAARLANHPERVAACQAVILAIKRGDMVRASHCSDCGVTDCKVEGHHDDYDQPLVVRWLCKRCHYKADRQRREQVGSMWRVERDTATAIR